MRIYAHNFQAAAIAAGHRFVLCLALLLLSVFSLRAGEFIARADSLASGQELPVIYYVVSEDFIRPSYMGNDKSMKELIRILRTGTVKSMVIEGSASPEGPVKGNVRLANDRAANLKDYILGMFPEMEGKITLISKVFEPTEPKNYPNLRYGRILSMEVEKEVVEEQPVVEEVEEVVEVADTTVTEPEPVVVPPVEEKKIRNTVAAVKTNLLYDAVTALNLEVEVPIGDRFSVMVEDVFPWWETGNKYCFQVWEMGVEARYWFKPWNRIGTEKLRGFFVGPYVMSAKYDFQWDKKINYQGEMWSAGATFGYATAIGRHKRVNLEFSISLGYMQSPYRHYLPTDDYSKLIHDPALDGTFYNYFLYPTKAKVSLVVPLNFPTKKEVSHE